MLINGYNGLSDISSQIKGFLAPLPHPLIPTNVCGECGVPIETYRNCYTCRILAAGIR